MKAYRTIKRRLVIFLFVILLIVVGINIPILSINHETSDNDYSNWMSETLDSDDKIVEVQMLGAHDAFSSEINFFSKVDEESAPEIMKGFVGTLIKGFLVRQSVTQLATPKELLEAGVRYFDIRLTYDGSNWVTKHNFISSDFDEISFEITTFLEENPGEFLVLDFQHIHGIDYTSDEDYLLFTSMLEETGLASYNFSSDALSLGDITYGSLTNDSSNSRVIIIDKFVSSEKSTYYYEEAINSSWANSDNFEDVISFLSENKTVIDEDITFEGFVVMQAVTTMNMSPSGILNSFKTWSLVERANQFNTYLLADDELTDLLLSMPIFMVDNVNSGSFINEAMPIIIEINQN